MIKPLFKSVVAGGIGMLIAGSLYFGCLRARADEIDQIVQAHMKAQEVPGVAVAVVKDGELIKAEAYGVIDTQSGGKVRTDTPFQIQSITKQFTAAGAMMLVEGGRFS